jgi:protein TonB
MFTTLVESRAVRPRSARGAAVSLLLHGTFIAAAVALTIPNRIDARPDLRKPPPITFITRPTVVPQHPDVQAPTGVHTPSAPTVPTLRIPLPDIGATTLPPIEIGGPALPPDPLIGIGRPIGGPPIGSGRGSQLTLDGIVDVNMVDRAPSIVGNAPIPRYPNPLRESGVAGRVVTRFVVDTLGRAEMDGVSIVETSHTLFSDAVKNVLGQYRFTPGTVGGRKVRTMVQVPFTFTLR